MDIDQDGHVDIVSGSYSRSGGGIPGMAGLFQVLYGQSGGKFKAAETLKGSDGEPLVIPGKGEDDLTKRICTRQFIVDWNGDGKLDIVTGNFEGTFFWFKGEGKGKFEPKPELINQAGKPMKITGVHSDPFVIDWDGDGDLDLLSGSSDAGVYFAENTAGAGKPPELKGFKALINPPGKEWSSAKSLREEDVKRPNYATRVWADDVNGDGKLDLFVGDSTALSSPKKGLAESQRKSKLAEWEKESAVAQKKYEEATKDIKDFKKLSPEQREAVNKASQELIIVQQKRAAFVTEERTGFVWLYLQK